MNQLEVTCEVIETKAKKKGLDLIYRVVLETEDPKIMALGLMPADSTVKVTFEETNA